MNWIHNFIQSAPELAAAIVAVATALVTAGGILFKFWNDHQKEVQQIKELIGKAYSSEIISSMFHKTQDEVDAIAAKKDA